MSDDLELQNIPHTRPAAARRTGVHSGRRLKVSVLRVAVVLALVLIVAYVSDGVALFFHTKECTKGLQTTTNLTTMANAPLPLSTVPTFRKNVNPCGDFWELHGSKCYYFSPSAAKLPWNESRAMCQSLNGDLVKIESREEQAFLFQSLLVEDDWFWIGLSDSQTEGAWTWTDGSPLNPNLTVWSKEPDDWKGPNNTYPEGEDCVLILAQKGYTVKNCWADVCCCLKQRFVCEKEAACNTTA